MIHQLLELISPQDFYRRAHQLIFEAMMAMADRRDPIDVVTLAAELRSRKVIDGAGGIEYLSQLVDLVPTSAHTSFYGKIIREMSLRRKIIHEAGEIVTEAFTSRGDVDAFIDQVEHRILSVAESRKNASFAHIADVVKDSIKQVEFLYVNRGPLTGTPSGFKDLDHFTHGFQPSDLIIVAGRPSMGKTALALSMARHASIDCGLACAVFSLEMSKEQIVMRLLCSEARVSNSKVRTGNLGESDFPRLVDAASKLASADVFIDDTPALSVLEMRAKVRRLHREKPLSLIVVDYLQLMRGASKRIERREQEISEISRSLKGIAKELNVPVIALSQLNRSVETRQDKRPMMADLRESGAIEQDADIIGFVYRDEVYHPDTTEKGIAEFIVAKHRNGPVGTVRLGFQGDFTLFVDLEQEAGYDYLGEDLALSDEDDLI